MAEPNEGNPEYTPAEPGAGAGGESWLDAEDYSSFSADDKKLLGGKYKNPVEAIKGGANAMRLLGKRGAMNAEFPEEGDPDFDSKMGAIYDRLGRPAKPEDYDFTIPEIPDALQGRVFFDEEGTSVALAKAHELGVSQKVLSELGELVLKGQLDKAQAQFDARIKAGEEAGIKLKAELGDADYATYFGTPDVDANGNRTNVGLVGRLLMNEGGPEIASELEESGLGNHPQLAKLLIKAADAMVKEGTIDKGGPAGAGGGGGGGEKELSIYEKNKRDYPHSSYMWGPENAK